MSNAYADLGLRGPLDDLDVIKAVWVKKKTRAHPDKGGDPADFDRVMKAWEVLSDPSQKAALDAQLTRSQNPTASTGASTTATGASGQYHAPQAEHGTGTATATDTRPVAEEHPWAGEAVQATARRSRTPWWAPALIVPAAAAAWIAAVSTVQTPDPMALEMFGQPTFSVLRAYGLAMLAWVVILLVLPAVLPVALIVSAVIGAAVVVLYGADYPLAHGIGVALALASLVAVRWSRTRYTALRRLYLHGTDHGAVLGEADTAGDARLASLASTIAATTAGAWSGEHLKVGRTHVQLVFVGQRAGALISAAHVPLPSRVLGGEDWQRVTAALHTEDLVRIRKTLAARGFAPSIYVVSGPGTGGSTTVAVDKHTTVTMLSPAMASAVIGSALVLNQPVVTRRPLSIAAAVNKLRST